VRVLTWIHPAVSPAQASPTPIDECRTTRRTTQRCNRPSRRPSLMLNLPRLCPYRSMVRAGPTRDREVSELGEEAWGGEESGLVVVEAWSGRRLRAAGRGGGWVEAGLAHEGGRAEGEQETILMTFTTRSELLSRDSSCEMRQSLCRLGLHDASRSDRQSRT
jgi:hypothetical protein